MKRNTKIELAGLAGSATAVAAALYIHKHRESPRKGVSPRKARKIGEELGVDWNRIQLDEFRRGIEVELEHGRRDPETDITNDDLALTGKIALAHLNQFPDYYTRLARMEEEARAYWHRESAEPASQAS
jgi:hypothetical protein